MRTPDWWSRAVREIDELVEGFSTRVGEKIKENPPGKLISTKNPFLYRARVKTDAYLLSQMIVNAFLSSSEETMFGNVLENIAISVCKHAKDGRKSSSAGIDLEYEEGKQRTIIQVKSGKNWGNAGQRKKLVQEFVNATKILRQGKVDVRCVEGVCYGISKTNDLGTHIQLVGNHFWDDISGWRDTSREVFKVIGKHAANGLVKAREDACKELVSYLKNKHAVTPDGEMKWNKLLDLVMLGDDKTR